MLARTTPPEPTKGACKHAPYGKRKPMQKGATRRKPPKPNRGNLAELRDIIHTARDEGQETARPAVMDYLARQP